jgi:hypothetical protein
MERRGASEGDGGVQGARGFKLPDERPRELRDAAYARRGGIAFLHQASRYRGKANYRDAIYLAYGTSVPTLLSGIVDDMLTVLKAFAAMAGAYCSLRMGKTAWTEFVDDLDRKKAISISTKDVW